MRRVIVLGALVLVGALSVAAFQQPAAQEMVVTVEKVKDNLYVLRGGGGNTAAFITANGVVLVDTKMTGWGKPLLEKIKTLTDKPVTTIINTHTHFDHVSGNVEFPATVDIVAHENTKTLMTQMNDVTGLGPQANVFKDNPGKGQPKRTFKDKMTIGNGADQIDLFYFGRAHTGGDAFVVFPALRVMHVGDTFPNKGLPIMDKNNGGSGVDYPTTLTNAVTNAEDCRHHHQRPHAREHHAGGAARVRRIHSRVRHHRSGGQEERQDDGRRGEQLEDAREVPGLSSGRSRRA